MLCVELNGGGLLCCVLVLKKAESSLTRPPFTMLSNLNSAVLSGTHTAIAVAAVPQTQRSLKSGSPLKPEQTDY